MASMTYDGRSFMLDGRRIWLTAGSIDPARLAPADWADRIHAARLAGLNTIGVPVNWSLVEPRPGKFDFSGRTAYRRFLELVAEAGLHAIVRPGPVVGEFWDMGGLPAWLAREAEVVPRSGDAAFLEACSRYISALADQLRDLQVTAQGRPGPIILIEQERGWTCGNDEMAAAYLGELSRYFREAGFAVPVVNTNDLWQSVEGQIDAWRGERGLFGTIRQLGAVRPDQPRLVMDFPSPRPVPLDGPGPEVPDPLVMLRRAAEAVAAGGQLHVTPFASGTTFGFWAGRDPAAPLSALAPKQDAASPVNESGSPGANYGPLRRLLSFTNAFGRVLAGVSDDVPLIVPNPDPTAGGDGASVIHASSAQGGVAWVFGTAEAEGSSGRRGASDVVPLLLPSGASLTVPLGRQRVAWCLLNVNLGGRATLDHSALSVLTASGRALVCFGPSGGSGEVSINGTPVEITVPGPREAHVELIEGVTVVVVEEETAETVFATREAVYVGVHSVTASGEPVPLPGSGKAFIKVTPAGDEASEPRVEQVSPPRAKPAPKPAVTSWELAASSVHAAGESPRYATIDGPADLGALGAPRGYGWYRAVVKLGAAKRCKVAAIGCGDRLHLFVDGQPAGVLGIGPGAKPELAVSLKRGDRTLVVLAENGGRLSSGSSLGEPKGLWRHLCEVTAVKAGKPAVEADEPLEPLGLGRPLMHVRGGDSTTPHRVRWTVAHRRKTALAVELGPVPARGLVIVNGQIETFLDERGICRLQLDAERLNRGNNTIDFAPVNDLMTSETESYVGELAEAMASALRVTEVNAELTGKASWAFAKWERPAAAAFDAVAKSAMASAASGPAWWRGVFECDGLDDRPLVLALSGMTRGQVYLNGEHIGRYAVATGDGTSTGGPAELVLPAALLVAGENELVFFDEHGGNPGKTKLTVDTSRRRFRAVPRS